MFTDRSKRQEALRIKGIISKIRQAMAELGDSVDYTKTDNRYFVCDFSEAETMVLDSGRRVISTYIKDVRHAAAVTPNWKLDDHLQGLLAGLYCEPVYVVGMNKLFEAVASKNCKQFVVLHEFGHVENGDCDREGNERELNREMEADAYAAQAMGFDDAIEAMEELILIDKALDKLGIVKINITELRTRCDRLVQLQKSEETSA